MSTATDAESHAVHEHPPHLAHHFDTEEQQFEADVQGMWLFLATEILLFAGLFCAYAVYRAHHPEIFYHAYKQHYLSVFWGSVNTALLLVSSFTIAAAVWCAQHNYQKWLVWMLVATLALGSGFLVVKYIEYSHKIHSGLLWGTGFNPQKHGHGHDDEHNDAHDEAHAATAHADEHEGDDALHDEPADAGASADTSAEDQLQWVYEPGGTGPRGLLEPGSAIELSEDEQVRNVQTFFGIYFLMTGLHGLHVIAGLLAITWLLVKALKGHFTAAYFTPVPIVGLYWHVVDLVWIYLFPLLYLIH